MRLTVPRGVPNGTTFSLKFGEVLSHPPLLVVNAGVVGGVAEYDGSVYSGNIFWGNQVDEYRSSEGGPYGEQVYEPRFTYHAFRYVELEVCPPLPPNMDHNPNPNPNWR